MTTMTRFPCSVSVLFESHPPSNSFDSTNGKTNGARKQEAPFRPIGSFVRTLRFVSIYPMLNIPRLGKEKGLEKQCHSYFLPANSLDHNELARRRESYVFLDMPGGSATNEFVQWFVCSSHIIFC